MMIRRCMSHKTLGLRQNILPIALAPIGTHHIRLNSRLQLTALIKPKCRLSFLNPASSMIQAEYMNDAIRCWFHLRLTDIGSFGTWGCFFSCSYATLDAVHPILPLNKGSRLLIKH